jgi:cell division septation protein DedD
VTDASYDPGTADDGFHEIHLSGKQLVFLFMATTIVSVLIFLLGVMVGRGVPAQAQAPDQFADPTPAAAAAPAPQPAAAQAGPPSAEPPPPAETDELSYKKRLESEASTAESLKRAPQPPAARSVAPAAASTSTASTSQQPVVGSPRPGTWVVQVHALRDRTVASGIVQRLVNKGYPAFLVAAGPPTGTYKVQVGRFKEKDEAQRAVERLKKEEQFNPWITR